MGAAGLLADIIAAIDMVAGWAGMTGLTIAAFSVGTTMLALWAWANWDRLKNRGPTSFLSRVYRHRHPTHVTWSWIKDRTYSCPEIACLLAGYVPGPAAMALPEVQAWMDRLTRQHNFYMGEPIDNATRQTAQMWLLAIYGASRGGEGQTPDLYRLYLGVITSLELKRVKH